MQAAFREVVRKKISPSKIIKRVAEGMNAVEPKFYTQEGRVTDSRDCIDFKERRLNAQLAAEMDGYFVPSQKIETAQSLDESTIRRISDIADRLRIAQLTPSQQAELQQSHVPLTIEASALEESDFSE